MSQETFDKLTSTAIAVSQLENFTEEELDAVIVQMAVLARSTMSKWGLTTEESKDREKKFLMIMESWPKKFQDRFRDKVLNSACPESPRTPINRFWDKPADAVLTALDPKKFI